MNILSFFEKIYLINLDERTDRWEKCLDIFQQYEFNSYERISGVKPLEEDFPYLDQTDPLSPRSRSRDQRHPEKANSYQIRNCLYLYLYLYL